MKIWKFDAKKTLTVELISQFFVVEMFGEDVSQLQTRIDLGNLDFLLNDLLTKPDGFDGVVLTAKSKLRRQCSGKNQGPRIVLVDRYMHGACIGVIVVRHVLCTVTQPVERAARSGNLNSQF